MSNQDDELDELQIDEELTEQQAALLAEIEDDEPSAAAETALESAIGKFLYVSTLLRLLAQWNEWCDALAEHEARTL